MTETTISNNFGWADPYSADYRPEIIQLIENVAMNKAQWSRNVIGVEVEVEDLESELYAYLFSKKNVLLENKFPAKLLHNVASDFCFKTRKDKGAAILGTDALNDILTNWDSIPQYIINFLYGEAFSKAGMPPGSYLRAIETHYKYKMKVSQRNLHSRAVERLAEVIDGVMVGVPDSFSRIQLNAGTPTAEDNYFTSDLSEEPDPSFKPYSATYACSNDHLWQINFPAKPKGHRIGTKTEYGFRYCKCGELLELAQ